MKVIDLFNKGANGEEMPEKIKYNGEIYYLNDGNYSTYNKYGYLKRFFQWEWSPFEHLNDEVEIIEEDKKIEKLHTSIDYTGVILSLTDIETRNKINEIIDVLNGNEGR